MRKDRFVAGNGFAVVGGHGRVQRQRADALGGGIGQEGGGGLRFFQPDAYAAFERQGENRQPALGMFALF